MARQVMCVKLKREAEGLDFPPYPGDLGRRVFDNVSKEAWKNWLEQQKMLLPGFFRHVFKYASPQVAGIAVSYTHL